MKTLTLKHNGHEAHVPYELPEAIWIDVFVPGHGVCHASVLLRADTVEVEEVTSQDTGPLPDALPDAENHPAVLEQAWDVARTFLEALPIEWSECDKAEDESAVAFVHRAGLIESSWRASTRPSDMAVLSTIAEMALLESDLHTAWRRLPGNVVDRAEMATTAPADPDEYRKSLAHHVLNAFLSEVLVPRAQDMATAAARRREAEWHEEQVQQAFCSRRAERTDLAIDLAKERA